MTAKSSGAEPSPSRRRFVLAGGAFAIAILAAASVLALSSFGGAETAQSGSLQVVGSESMHPIVTACAEDFMATFPETDVIVRGGGSGEGVSALLHGLTEIAMSSRELTPRERDYAAANNIDLSAAALAIDGIAIVVHPSNPLREIDLARLKAIYSGSSRRWRDLTTMDGDIATIARASGSGTAALFGERVLGGDEPAARQFLATNEAIVEAVAAEPRAIGYAGLGAVHRAGGRVKMVAVRPDGKKASIAPAAEALRSGTYPLGRNLYLLHTVPPSDTAKSFLAHCQGPRGQALIQGAGYVGVSPEAQ